jgi:hypothetical protein
MMETAVGCAASPAQYGSSASFRHIRICLAERPIGRFPASSWKVFGSFGESEGKGQCRVGERRGGRGDVKAPRFKPWKALGELGNDEASASLDAEVPPR